MTSDAGSLLQHTLHYAGRVQGVGFRYTAQQVAAGFAVTGTVRNLDDGRVELIVEGESDELARFEAELLNVLQDNIKGVECAESPATGMHAGFRIVQ